MESSQTSMLMSKGDSPKLEKSGDGVSEGAVCALIVIVLGGVATAVGLYFSFWPTGKEGTAPPSSETGPCKGAQCTLVQQLHSIMATGQDPCGDFYSFVCGNYRSSSGRMLVQMEDEMYASLFRALDGATVPYSGQSAAEKAAALYKACTSGDTDETAALQDFLSTVGLGPGQYQSAEPLDKILGLFFRYNLITLLGLWLEDNRLSRGYRELKVSLSDVQLSWFQERGPAGMTAIYSRTLGLPAQEISYAESEAAGRLSQDVLLALKLFNFNSLDGLDRLTPNIARGRWTALVNTYTNGKYRGDDEVQVSEPALRYFNMLYAELGSQKLSLLTAWELLRSLMPLAMVGVANQQALREQCLYAVRKAMEVPLVSWYLFMEVPPATVAAARTMVSHIRDSILEEIHDSHWLSGNTKKMALYKVQTMGLHVGYPEYFNFTKNINRAYRDYPDVAGSFLHPWLKAMEMTITWMATNSTSFRYSVATTNAAYLPMRNKIMIPATVLRSPMFSPTAPKAFNYGGLGGAVGHEITHAFDRTGSLWDAQGRHVRWWSQHSQEEYDARVGCLRRSHNTRDGSQDSENTADWAGLASSYGAFTGLDDEERAEKFSDFPFEPDQLFFISSCVKWCANVGSEQSKGYASWRNRCNVPLRNMEAFGEAFQCHIGSYMRPDPAQQCDFW